MLLPSLGARLVPLLAFALSLACSESGRTASSRQSESARPSSPARAESSDRERPERKDAPSEPQPIDPATLGSIRVRCLLAGNPPKRGEIDVSREPACDVHATPPLSEKVVAADGKLANVYVRIKSGQNAWQIPSAPADPVQLDQKGCLYTPHVVALQLGQKLLVRNEDPLNHNVNFGAKRNDRKNVNQAPRSPALEFDLGRAEQSIPVKCDIHPWMGAWVHVEEHPWFGVSDASGELVIQGVPPGEYSLEAIHEVYGKLREDVVVAPSGAAEVSFTYEAEG